VVCNVMVASFHCLLLTAESWRLAVKAAAVRSSSQWQDTYSG
jgi:hypothetical protein